MRDRESSRDDTSTESYREEQGQDPVTGGNTTKVPGPSLGASIRGVVGQEAAPNDSTGSPGADADRAAAEERDDPGRT